MYYQLHWQKCMYVSRTSKLLKCFQIKMYEKSNRKNAYHYKV